MNQPNKTLDIAKQKQLAKTWLSAGPALEMIRQAELKSMSEEEHLRAFFRVLTSDTSQDLRQTSELADFQRKLHRITG
jgi:hypothetical protein